MGIGHERDDDREIDHGQIANDAEDHLLLGAFDVRDADEFGGTTEIGVLAGGGDLRNGFAAPHQPAGIDGVAALPLDRDRLAGEHRLIDEERPFNDPQIGRDDLAERKLHDVVGNEVRRCHVLPGAVALHACPQREALLEQRQRGIGARFLEHAEPDVKEQQRRDRNRFEMFADHDLQRDRRFEHPRHRRPEMVHDPLDRVHPLLVNAVRTELGEGARGFRRRQPDRVRGLRCRPARRNSHSFAVSGDLLLFAVPVLRKVPSIQIGQMPVCNRRCRIGDVAM